MPVCGSRICPASSAAQRIARLMSSASTRALVKSGAIFWLCALVSRIAPVPSKPFICAASAAPSRPLASNSSRSKFELTWMSIEGVAVAWTCPLE